MILSHSAELLDGSRRRKDPGNIATLVKLVAFIAANQDKFRCKLFNEIINTDADLPAAKPLVKLGVNYSLHRAVAKITRLIQARF